MKKIFYVFLFAAVDISFGSCIAIKSTTISDINQSVGNKVVATASGCGVLHLSVPLGIVEKAALDLKEMGANGNITTVLTMREWGLFQYYKVTATGFVLEKEEHSNQVEFSLNNTNIQSSDSSSIEFGSNYRDKILANISKSSSIESVMYKSINEVNKGDYVKVSFELLGYSQVIYGKVNRVLSNSTVEVELEPTAGSVRFENHHLKECRKVVKW